MSITFIPINHDEHMPGIYWGARCDGWEGHVEMAYAEVVRSSLGMHYIGHHIENYPILKPIDRSPEWVVNPGSGAWSYTCDPGSGLAFAGKITPLDNTIQMDFAVTNTHDKPISGIRIEMCPRTTHLAGFGERHTLAPIHTLIDGKLTSLAETTPAASTKDRHPWLIMNVKGTSRWIDGECPTWWAVDQTADTPELIRTSADGTRQISVSWNRADNFMVNTGIPCLHHGLVHAGELHPGDNIAWQGEVRFQND